MNKLYLLLLAFVFCIGTTVQGQSLKRFKAKAVEASNAKDFSRALEYYQLIINEADDKSIETYYHAAESARNFRIYNMAEEYYREVIRQDSTETIRFHLAHYYLGVVLKNQSDYIAAKNAFQTFIDKHASFARESFKVKAEKEIQDCIWADGLKKDATRIDHLDTTVNTPSSEFSPLLLDNQLYYSSVRFLTTNEYEPKAFTRGFISEDNKQGQAIPNDFDEDLKHTANLTFNEAGDEVYYTLCTSVNASEARCEIYQRKKENEKWGKRQALPSPINLANFTNTHPNIGFDEFTDRVILFFVSDRPTDVNDNNRDLNIWFSFREADGQFGAPVCTSAFNSSESDVTPFFHSATQTLYFSSNGRQNVGGFDIYSIKRVEGDWGKAEHQGIPLNSSYDDLYYTKNPEGTYAHFSSNRPGSLCSEDNKLCVSNDIYAVPKIGLRVLTFNKITGEPLFGTEVALKDTKVSDASSQSKEESHLYTFPVGFDREYSVDGTKSGYIPDAQSFNTNNAKPGEVKEIKLYLTPAVQLDALTFHKVTGEPLSGCKVELFEVKDDLLSEDELLASKEELTSVQYNYGLNFKKKYMVVGSKPLYSRDTFYVTTVGIPVIPTSLMDSLFLCKTPPGPDLISLYFYNDEPDRRTRRSSTTTTYSEAYESYLSLRQEFTVAFAYDPEELGKIERFFEEDVKGGYDNLESFSLLLNEYFQTMETGDTLKVIIRGFASPRAKNDYNYNLTQRRINSLRNYFAVCHNGLLKPYLDQLVLVEDPRGEDSAPDGIQDDISDRKNSIYSVVASKERRVDILRIVLSKDACQTTIPDITSK